MATSTEVDVVAAGMLGLSPLEFGKMTDLAKRQYRPLAATLLQVFELVPRGRLEEVEALKLDPANSTTPRCIDDYNAGLTNAVATIRGEVPR